MKRIRAAIVAALSVFGSILSAAAQAPVAVVEEVKGRPSGVEFMDYVTAGQVIKLGPNESIVLGYLKSCWRETITGGTVVVGAEQSLIHLGDIQRVRVDCDGRSQPLTDQQARDSAATVFRGITNAPPAAAQARVVIHGLSPIVEVNGDGKLVVERLDKPGERHEAMLRRKSLLRGKFFDFASVEKTLAPGGVYAASFGERKTVFVIDPHAKPGATPVIGRLVRFD